MRHTINSLARHLHRKPFNLRRWHAKGVAEEILPAFNGDKNRALTEDEVRYLTMESNHRPRRHCNNSTLYADTSPSNGAPSVLASDDEPTPAPRNDAPQEAAQGELCLRYDGAVIRVRPHGSFAAIANLRGFTIAQYLEKLIDEECERIASAIAK
jgi:hypothetical protein